MPLEAIIKYWWTHLTCPVKKFFERDQPAISFLFLGIYLYIKRTWAQVYSAYEGCINIKMFQEVLEIILFNCFQSKTSLLLGYGMLTVYSSILTVGQFKALSFLIKWLNKDSLWDATEIFSLASDRHALPLEDCDLH
jgi:hypothetical protein